MPLSANGTAQPLHFANGNVANLLAASPPDQAEAVLNSLAVRPCDFILLLLGAAPESPALADPALEQFAGPLLALLVGDSLCAAEETLAAVRNGIPLAVLRGGHLADDIANARQPRAHQ